MAVGVGRLSPTSGDVEGTAGRDEYNFLAKRGWLIFMHLPLQKAAAEMGHSVLGHLLHYMYIPVVRLRTSQE
jgi:hypothetical protein